MKLGHQQLMNREVRDVDYARIQEIHERSQTDYLTGFYNRHALEVLTQHPKFSQAMLILIDLDHLKLINDTYGHIVGDSAVRGMTQKISRVFAQEDHYKFRMGGDEFLVVWPTSDYKQAYTKAQQLLEVCREPIFCAEVDQKLVLGASIGISCYEKAVCGFPQALAQSDEMVYVAKRKGRNRIEMTLTTKIEELPIITDEELHMLAQLREQELRIGYFDMLSTFEEYYYQFLTEFLGLKIKLEKITQKQHTNENFSQFDCLIHAVSIAIPDTLEATYIPFELSPLVLLTQKDGTRYSIEQAKDVPMGMSRLLYNTIKEYVNGSDYFHVYETLDEATIAFEKGEVAALLTSSYFFKYANLKEMAVPVYRQEVSDVTTGIVVNHHSPAAFLAPIIKRYLQTGGKNAFRRQTKHPQALRTKVQAFLTTEEKQLLRQKATIRVFLQQNHGGFSRFNHHLDCYTGQATNVLNYLATVLDLQFEIVDYQGGNEEQSPVIASLRNHQADLSFAVFLAENLAYENQFFQGLSLSLPFSHTAPVVLTSMNRAKLSLTHLSRMKVGLLATSYVKNYLRVFNIQAENVVQYTTVRELILALQNYEIQALILSRDTAEEAIQRAPLRMEYQFPYYVERTICAREEDLEFLQIINKAFVFINEAELTNF